MYSQLRSIAGGRRPILNPRPRHAVVTGDPPHMGINDTGSQNLVKNDNAWDIQIRGIRYSAVGTVIDCGLDDRGFGVESG
jgi:hypothetical protein